MSALVFMDTETTGLSLDDDDIWEFAAVRREPDGSERRVHMFVDHDRSKCSRLPEPFLADHRLRMPDADDWRVVTKEEAARIVANLTSDRPYIVGAVPSFDAERLALLLRTFGLEPTWHHRLRCAETLACGRLGREVGGLGDAARALGIDVDPAARHTAMGDVRLCVRIWDKVMGS